MKNLLQCAHLLWNKVWLLRRTLQYSWKFPCPMFLLMPPLLCVSLYYLTNPITLSLNLFLGNCARSLGFFQCNAHKYCRHEGYTKLVDCAIVSFLKKIFPNLCRVLYSYSNVHFNCLKQANISFNLCMSIFLYQFYLKLHRNADLLKKPGSQTPKSTSQMNVSITYKL